ncbi:MAG: transporter substrate-binding domain-containing protein, partial [Propionivibrio sp.]|nr:transporter substrate-binding domain-containing protein [Propionivibrio sp.]
MKKQISLLVVALVAGVLLSGCGKKEEAAPAAAAPEAALAPAAAIVVGLDDNFPPMGFKDEKNELVGFDIDLA